MNIVADFMRSLPRRRTLAVAFSLALLPTLGGCQGMFARPVDPKAEGMRFYQEKNYSEAAGAFRNAVRQDPRDYKSFYHLAVACDADGRYQEAIESYRTALSVQNVTYAGQEDKDFRQKILDGLAITVAKSDSHDAQLNAFERQAKASNKAEDFWLLAKIYRYRGDADSALDDYNHAALLDNKNFLLLKDYGLYLQQVGQGQRATTALSQAYRLNDKDEQVNAALTQLGIVVGPSLKERNELASPAIPKGPIPPMNLTKIKNGLGLGGGSKDATGIEPQPITPTAPEAPASSLQAPRD